MGSLADVLAKHREECSRHVNSGSNQFLACDYAVLTCALQNALGRLEDEMRDENSLAVKLANVRIQREMHQEKTKELRAHLEAFLSKKGVPSVG